MINNQQENPVNFFFRCVLVILASTRNTGTETMVLPGSYVSNKQTSGSPDFSVA